MKSYYWCQSSPRIFAGNVLLPLGCLPRCSDKNPLKTNKNNYVCAQFSLYLAQTGRVLNMWICRSSVRYQCRKRFHMQGFEWVSVIPRRYPLPHGKRVRWPGLDGLWSASPGDGGGRRGEGALFLRLLWWSSGGEARTENRVKRSTSLNEVKFILRLYIIVEFTGSYTFYGHCRATTMVGRCFYIQIMCSQR